ncbi:hypothetical protein [Paenibacillus sp. J22TS3]|uniref:hypothetical protein n=1 Tax=Paenibacillus sp. J22TS3 TaxID=2807192 RepID=UPI001B184943|nr:hypothetical protein [Paenibacillus sp. J22TS3]GIP21777.1 hypothetical protein J22TS3_20520 [Paenibacillus sp. J22TS3]
MKKTWKITAAAVFIGGGLLAGSLMNLQAEGAGVANQPGTADDPVVTKSYVDQQIQKALGGGSGGGSTPTKPTPNTGSGSGAGTGTGGGTSAGGAASSDGIEVVTLKPGQTMVAKAGAEFIVRGGKAVIYSADANGVADLTDGIDVANGEAAKSNHLLSFPREGRGIQVADGQKMSVTVMVRGGYVIK